MALIDDPREWILQLFRREESEGRGADCQRFDGGANLEDLPLTVGELVFGVYKDKYFFTPISLIWSTREGLDSIRWEDVQNCTSRHGGGDTYSTLTLVDGSTKRIRVGDMATGWQGRISQLFHQLIERHGSRASLGHPLRSPSDFFSAVTDRYSFAPNLEPHLSLDELRLAVESLSGDPLVKAVFFKILEIEDGELVSDGLVVCGPTSPEILEQFAEVYGADGVFEATEESKRKTPATFHAEPTWELYWD